MKFILTGTKHPTLDVYRIMASETGVIVRDGKTYTINSGDIGGFIQKKENLDEASNAWVFDDSVVMGESKITGISVVEQDAILDNVIMGSSYVRGLHISDITFANEVRVYGTDISMTVADKDLLYRALTANRFNPAASDIYIGYSNFFGVIDDFQKFVESGYVSESDQALCKEYIPLIKRSLAKK